MVPAAAGLGLGPDAFFGIEDRRRFQVRKNLAEQVTEQVNGLRKVHRRILNRFNCFSIAENGKLGWYSRSINFNSVFVCICQTIDIRSILGYTISSLVRQLDFLLMSTLLIKNAAILVTMDDRRREISDGGLFVRDGFIEKVGPTSEIPGTADEVLDLSGHIILPGLINTHHHFYQTLTRAVPAAQDANLFNWLKTLYPIWARLTPDDIFISTQTALAELALSGCTTASDHLYLFPMAPGWTMKSLPPGRSASASRPRAAPCH